MNTKENIKEDAYKKGFNEGREAIIEELLFKGFDSLLIKSILNLEDTYVTCLEDCITMQLKNININIR